MEAVRLARNAMNTRFELVLHGDNPVTLRAAGEAALAEIERIENQLSLFKPGSEIARVNALAAQEPTRVSPEVFGLLQRAQQLSRETDGTFDITMAPLLRCWGLLGRSDGRVPSEAEVEAARAICGHSLIELNPSNFTVKFARAGVMIDLGAIGKGYGVECAIETLLEGGVSSALIHGGTSTIAAIGAPPGAATWKVAVDQPTTNQAPAQRFEVCLRDESLSVSAVSGKSFVANGRTLGHIIDPRTGAPAMGALLAAVALPSATETDALSTALLVQGLDGFEPISALRPQMRTLVVAEMESGTAKTLARGIEPASGRIVR